jgi:probable rRNA maturation factor
VNIVLLDEQDDPLQPEPLVDLAGVVLRGESLPDATEVAITLVDELRIAALNEAHLGKTGPTDVLSFPLEDLEAGHPPDAPDADGPPFAIGDVVICAGYVRKRSETAGVPFADEMALMVVHGLLHLLGYDHVEDGDAEAMEARERRYLAAVGRTRP